MEWTRFCLLSKWFIQAIWKWWTSKVSSSILFMSFLITERDIYYELCIMLTLFLKLNHFFASTLVECDKKSSAERTPCPKKLIIAESSNSVHFFSKVLHIASCFLLPRSSVDRSGSIGVSRIFMSLCFAAYAKFNKHYVIWLLASIIDSILRYFVLC